MVKFYDLNTFLKLGYYLDYVNPRISFDYSKIDKSKYISYDERELVTEGSRILLNAISKKFKINQKHVVPLSGGLDSRAILAGLLMNTEAKNIKTYTFGTPGTLDYNIGNYIAKELGTDHINFPLINLKYNTEELIEISEKFDHQTVLFHHPPIKELEKMYGDSIFWSGYMGDPIAGSHLPNKEGDGIKDELIQFINRNTFVKSINLNSPNYKINDSFKLIDYDFEDIDKLTLSEKIDFDNRQLKYVAPHVLMKGNNFALPFLDKDWFNFMLSIDNKYRRNEYLYKKILLESFPFEFSLKTKSNYGLPLSASNIEVFIKRTCSKMNRILNGKNININYLDFNREIRENKTMRKTIQENLRDLERRKIVSWLDLNKIWQDHINKSANYADAIMVLCSLEIQMKAKN